MDWLDAIQTLDFPAELPARLLEVEQTFDTPSVEDVAAEVERVLRAADLPRLIQPGQTVAVGMGSRGIYQIATIGRAVIEHLKRIGAQPFIFPAMGSHGGATADEQQALLGELGITEASTCAPIRATMEVVEIGQIPDGPALFQDVYARAADHTILINRVKPHTDFSGEIESGLSKMAVIGMGKQRGASLFHVYGVEGLRRFLKPAARIYEAATNLRGGLAILENASGGTAGLHWLDVAQIGLADEMGLLRRAYALLPSLPFDRIDILVVREIGKNIAGTGMDTNIINRLLLLRQPEPTGIDIGVIAALDLTPESHGNAAGIGLANVTTARLLRKFDIVATYTNAITAGILGMQRNNLPLVLPSDRAALAVALRCCGLPAERARWVFIENTLKLRRLWVSEHYRAEVDAHPRLTLNRTVDLAFDPDGTLTSPWSMV
jgi:hypothetical protein